MMKTLFDANFFNLEFNNVFDHKSNSFDIDKVQKDQQKVKKEGREILNQEIAGEISDEEDSVDNSEIVTYVISSCHFVLISNLL